MKRPLILFLFSAFIPLFSSAQGMWTWINGSNTTGAAAVYGTAGIPSATNTPPNLYESCEWTDLQGNFWLFGGMDNNYGKYNDLWKYDPVANEWTWVKGSGGTVNAAGNYGTKGTPSINNNPPGKGFAWASWVDLNGDLWMFGGENTANGLDDLWKYNIAANTWTWINGSVAVNVQPVYGTKGIPSPTNTPGFRMEFSATWVDSIGNLWLLGGFDGITTFNDLWKYDIAANEWTWMSGTAGTTQNGVYGTIGVADTANFPGSRFTYASWKDLNGKFWLFGGTISGNYFNDMWKYEPSTNKWSWMSGSSQENDPGNYGATCASSVNYAPASRYENRSRWTDDCGKFWMYGGAAYNNSYVFYNDLWNFDPLTLKWTLANGSSVVNAVPVFGTKGVPNSSNQPGSRAGGISWKGSDGTLYLFGGSVNGWANRYNDLWTYKPDPNCPAGGGVTKINLGNDTSYCGSFSRVLSTNIPATVWSTGATASQITVTGAGTYWASINGSCGVASDTIVIKVSSAASAGTISAATDSICMGSPAGLVVTSASGTLQWQVSSNGILFTDIAGATSSSYNSAALTQNTYYRVKASSSCDADSSSAFLINVSSLPVAGISALTRDSICGGTGITSLLSVSGGSGNVQWQSSTDGIHFSPIGGATSNTYTTPRTLAQTTYYRAVATNNCGIDSSNIVTVHIVPAPFVSFDYTINNKQVSFQADSASANVTSYSWDFGDGRTSKEINPVHAFDSLETYYVCLTVYNGSNCSYTFCKYVTTLNIGVETVSSNQSIQFYPNPANNTLNLLVNGFEGNYRLKIYNVLGQQVKAITEIYLEGNENIPINLSGIVPGTYELILMNGKEYYTKRFVHLK